MVSPLERVERVAKMAKDNPAKNRQPPLTERLSALAQAHKGDEKGLRLAVLDTLRAQMADDRAAARRDLEEKRLKGAKCAETLSAQMDAMLGALADFVSTHILFIANPTDGEKVTMVAVGAMFVAAWRLIPTLIFCFCCPISAMQPARALSNIFFIFCGIWG